MVDSAHTRDRRQPRISVQELRRALREADEERYRLTIQTGDSRHPRVNVQQLRRDLREADEDRFRLTMRMRSLVRRGTVGVLLLLTAGAGLVLWTALAPAPPVDAPPSSASFAPLYSIDDSLLEEAVILPAAVEVEPPDERPAFRNRATPKSRSRSVQAPEPEPPARVIPRPLHPGEFGRKAQAG